MIQSQKNIEKLLIAALFLISSIIIIGKTIYATQDFRYISYGFDSTRILGFTQQIIQSGTINPSHILRLGLPLYAIFWVKLLHLSPSQSLLVPFWTLSLGGLICIIYLSWLVKDLKTAAISAFIFSLITPVFNLNYSHFFNFIIAPLRLSFLFIYLSPKPSRFKLFTLSLVIFLNFYSYLTYAPLATLLDSITLAILLVYLCFYPRSKPKMILILISQVFSFILYALLYQKFFPQYSPLEFLLRVFTLQQVDSLNPQIFISALAIFFMLEISLVILLSILKVKLSPPPKIKLHFDQHPVLLSTLSLSAIFYLLGSIIPVLIYYLPAATSQTKAQLPFSLRPLLFIVTTTFVARFTLSLFLLPQTWKRISLNHASLLTICALYFFLIESSVVQKSMAYLANDRIKLLFLPLAIVSIASSLTSKKSHIIFLLVGLLSTPLLFFSSFNTLQRYRIPGNRPTLRAMDWFVHQPNYQNSLIYSDQFSSPGITPHELPDSLYFAYSQTPYRDQRKLAKCRYYEKNCFLLFDQYIRENHIKYLILQDVVMRPHRRHMLTLGELIYDDGVQIVKIY